MNYTIQLLEGIIDTAQIAAKWTDETTGRGYSNVFALTDPCKFPDNIKEGDEFYFSIDNNNASNCTMCMAYYPVPAKKLAIHVVPGPCKP